MAQGQGHSVDEYLETIYFLAFPIGEYRPDPDSSSAIASRVAEMLGVSRASAGEMLKRLEAEGLVERGEHKEALLTAAGIVRAERVVRKHRIIERFLTDFMGYTAAEAHVHADELGDTFSEDMVERIEERLGNPERCPHGWPVDPAFEQAENKELAPLDRPESRAAGGDRPARRARRRAAALVLRRGLHAGDAGRDPRGATRRSPVQGAAGRQGRAGDRREGRRRPLRPRRGAGLDKPRRQATCVQVRDRLDRDHRIHAGGGRERRAVRDDEVAAPPTSRPSAFAADVAGEPPIRAEPMMWKE